MEKYNPNLHYEGKTGILLEVPGKVMHMASSLVSFSTELLHTVSEIRDPETRLIALPITISRKK